MPAHIQGPQLCKSSFLSMELYADLLWNMTTLGVGKTSAKPRAAALVARCASTPAKGDGPCSGGEGGWNGNMGGAGHKGLSMEGGMQR